MSRQLKAQGQTVGLLGFIDPASPGDHRLVRSAIGRFGSLIRASQEKQLEWFLRYIYLRIASYKSKVQDAARRMSSESENRKTTYYKNAPIHPKFHPCFPPVH